MAPKRGQEPTTSAQDGALKQKKRSKHVPEGPSLATQQDIQLLEEQITQSRKNYNNVAILLQHAQAQDPHIRQSAQTALCRVFVRLWSTGFMNAAKASSGNDSVISQWLQTRYKEYWGLLLDAIRTDPLSDQKQCLRLLMQLLKEESTMDRSPKLSVDERLATVVEAFTTSGDRSELHLFFIERYAGKYKDLLAATFRSSAIVLKKAEGQEVVDSTLHFLQKLAELEPDDLWIEPSSRKVDISKEQAEAWLALLSKAVTKQQRKVLLELIPTKIAPCIRRPERLLDFITDAFDAGGSTSLLALSGLFELIKSRNLDYPQFYRKVYSLLDPFILHSKHRSRFLRLLEIFLDSTHLPAILVASFIKRLTRLCLFAPPPAIAVITPMVYNLLKGHPQCTFMIHRVTCCKDHAIDVSTDPFSMDEEDPMETGALESSLWELYSLQTHYNPNVATICKIISEQFTKPTFNLEDFLDHSYASMLETDLSKQMKKEPVVEYMIPKTVFPLSAESQDGPLESPLAVWSFQR